MKDWGGKKYEDLAPNLKTLFKEYKIKMICYTVRNPIGVSDDDLEFVGRDLFRRYNFGITALKNTDIERAKYCHDELTHEFKELLKIENEFYNKCIKMFSIGTKKPIEEREKINLLLITIRELITMQYIPIIGEKNIQFNRKIVDRYYDKFVRKLLDKEQVKKINEFKRIFNKLWLIRERLKEVNNNLQNDPQFFKSIYWMLSVCYNNFSNQFYDFNIDKFCHYIQDGGQDYFETFNRISGYDTKQRINYMKEYLEKELKLDISDYSEKIKKNKKAIIYQKDITVNKDKDWNSPFLEQQLTTRKEKMELKEIRERIKDNRFIVRPYYQRGEVISTTKASRLVESTILGVKIPPIYLYKQIQKNGLSKDIVLDRTTKID